MAFSFAETDKRQIDSYKRAGWPVERLETDLFYLADLTCYASIEMHNHSIKKETDLYATKRLAEILHKYEGDKAAGADFLIPSAPFYRTVIATGCNKNIKTIQDLGLEMKLLSDISKLSQRRLKEMRNLCRELSRNFLSAYDHANGGFQRRLAA